MEKIRQVWCLAGPGVEHGVRHLVDCAWRDLAPGPGRALQPARGSLVAHHAGDFDLLVDGLRNAQLVGAHVAQSRRPPPLGGVAEEGTGEGPMLLPPPVARGTPLPGPRDQVLGRTQTAHLSRFLELSGVDNVHDVVGDGHVASRGVLRSFSRHFHGSHSSHGRVTYCPVVTHHEVCAAIQVHWTFCRHVGAHGRGYPKVGVLVPGVLYPLFGGVLDDIRRDQPGSGQRLRERL